MTETNETLSTQYFKHNRSLIFDRITFFIFSILPFAFLWYSGLFKKSQPADFYIQSSLRSISTTA